MKKVLKNKTLTFFLPAIILINILLLSDLFGQNQYNFSQFGDESAEMFKRPLNWSGTDWLTFSAIAAGTFGLMQVDSQLHAATATKTNIAVSFPMEFGRYYGEGYLSVLLGTGLLLHGISNDNIANKRFGFEILQTFVYSFTVNGIIKIAAGRARPYVTDDPHVYEPIQFRTNDYLAFPSLHSTWAFALSTVIASKTDNKILKALWYAPALLTVASRVYQNYHWTSDVFLGAAIGYFIGKYFVDQHDKKNEGGEEIPPAANNITIVIPF